MARKINFNFPCELFNESFLPYMEAQKKIQLYVGNRGSGKTKYLLQKAVIFALTKKYFRLVYAKKVARTLRDSVFQGFKDVITEWNLGAYFQIKETEMDIICKLNGNMILSFGLDVPDKLKGISDPSHVLWDEMTEGSFQDYASLIGILRTKKVKQTQFWGTFNPEHGFWGREYFFVNHEDDEINIGEVPAKTADTLIYKATFKDNRFIDAVEYEAKLLELAEGDENKLIVWIEGNWGHSITGNEYFTSFKKSVHVQPAEFITGKAMHETFDFNFSPYMTGICAQVNITDIAFEIRLFKEYCLKDPHNSTEHVCLKTIEDYDTRIVDYFYYGDASGASKIAGLGNVTAFDAVEKIMFKYLNNASRRVMKKNPPVMKRRDFMNKLLAGKLKWNGLTITLIIDPTLKETIKDFMNLKVGPDGKLKKKVKDPKTGITYEELGHTSDAVEYFIIQLLWDLFSAKE